jgi:hypothetical protein
MKATIKLRPTTTPPAPTPAAPVTPCRLDVHGFGRRCVAGESIRALGREAGLPWNVLQGKLRVAGYLRAPKLTL